MTRLEPASTALLLIDVQNDYWRPPREPRPAFLDAAARLLALARDRGLLVVHVQHARREGSGKSGFVGGTHGFDVHDAVRPLPEEARIVKHTPGSFYETDLESLLRGAGIETVVVAGIQTQKCCDTTVREASARRYRAILVRDAVETFDLTGPDGEVVGRDEIQRATFAALANGFAEVLTLAQLEELLPAPAAVANRPGRGSATRAA